MWLPRQSRFYFVFIPEFVERLPTIFPVNIWITNLFEIEHRWAKWLISDPSTEGTLWISDPVIRLQITQISDPMIRLLISLRSVIQWSVFRSRRSGIRWILVQSGFDRSLIWKWICSKGTPQIRNPDPDSPKGTHPKIFSLGLFMEKIKMSCCIPFPVSSISVPVHSFSGVPKYHRLNQSELC